MYPELLVGLIITSISLLILSFVYPFLKHFKTPKKPKQKPPSEHQEIETINQALATCVLCIRKINEKIDLLTSEL